jgi:hypothetical protein
LEQEKEAKKQALEEKNNSEELIVEQYGETNSETQKEVEEEDELVSVKKWEFKGKMYLKSSVNVVYDMETQDEIGVWSEEKQDIIFSELEEEEEEEEE